MVPAMEDPLRLCPKGCLFKWKENPDDPDEKENRYCAWHGTPLHSFVGLILWGYKIVRPISGKGGFGATYYAEHAVNRDLRSAIKILKPPHCYADDRVELFMFEAGLGRGLNVHQVPDIYTVGRKPWPHIIMAYIDGHTLHDEFERLRAEQGRESSAPWMDNENARGILIGISIALEASHRAGLIHRDLKPLNVMLVDERDDDDPSQWVRVIDWGIAVKVDAKADVTISEQETREEVDRETDPDPEAIRAGTQLFNERNRKAGSLEYMAPEQFDGESDEKTDIYQFGLVAYELLTGKYPYQAADTSQRTVTFWHNLHTSADFEPLNKVRKHIPSEIVSVVEKCLEKDPEDRPESMTAIRLALKKPEREPRVRRVAVAFMVATIVLCFALFRVVPTAVNDFWGIPQGRTDIRVEGGSATFFFQGLDAAQAEVYSDVLRTVTRPKIVWNDRDRDVVDGAVSVDSEKLIVRFDPIVRAIRAKEDLQEKELLFGRTKYEFMLCCQLGMRALEQGLTVVIDTTKPVISSVKLVLSNDVISLPTRSKAAPLPIRLSENDLEGAYFEIDAVDDGDYPDELYLGRIEVPKDLPQVRWEDYGKVQPRPEGVSLPVYVQALDQAGHATELSYTLVLDSGTKMDLDKSVGRALDAATIAFTWGEGTKGKEKPELSRFKVRYGAGAGEGKEATVKKIDELPGKGKRSSLYIDQPPPGAEWIDVIYDERYWWSAAASTKPIGRVSVQQEEPPDPGRNVHLGIETAGSDKPEYFRWLSHDSTESQTSLFRYATTDRPKRLLLEGDSIVEVAWLDAEGRQLEQRDGGIDLEMSDGDEVSFSVSFRTYWSKKRHMFRASLTYRTEFLPPPFPDVFGHVRSPVGIVNGEFQASRIGELRPQFAWLPTDERVQWWFGPIGDQLKFADEETAGIEPSVLEPFDVKEGVYVLAYARYDVFGNNNDGRVYRSPITIHGRPPTVERAERDDEGEILRLDAKDKQLCTLKVDVTDPSGISDVSLSIDNQKITVELAPLKERAGLNEDFFHLPDPHRSDVRVRLKDSEPPVADALMWEGGKPRREKLVLLTGITIEVDVLKLASHHVRIEARDRRDSNSKELGVWDKEVICNGQLPRSVIWNGIQWVAIEDADGNELLHSSRPVRYVSSCEISYAVYKALFGSFPKGKREGRLRLDEPVVNESANDIQSAIDSYNDRGHGSVRLPKYREWARIKTRLTLDVAADREATLRKHVNAPWSVGDGGEMMAACERMSSDPLGSDWLGEYLLHWIGNAAEVVSGADGQFLRVGYSCDDPLWDALRGLPVADSETISNPDRGHHRLGFRLVVTQENDSFRKAIEDQLIAH